MASGVFVNIILAAVILSQTGTGFATIIEESTQKASAGYKQFPVVGIMTLPPNINQQRTIKHQHYVTYMSTKIMELGGALPVYIPYNISAELLYPLLDQLNGVFFTGGSLDLVDPLTNLPHPYTATSKLIFEYAKDRNDQNDYFPLLGICQGFELLHILAADNPDALGWATLLNDHISVGWRVNPLTETRMFANYDPDLLLAMNTEKILFHFHNRGVPYSYYDKYPSLHKFFKVISAETIEDKLIISAVEAHDYPFYAVYYHPEIPFEQSQSINSVRSETNYRIAHEFSSFFVKELMKNSHVFHDMQTLQDHLITKAEMSIMRFIGPDFIGAYGFNY